MEPVQLMCVLVALCLCQSTFAMVIRNDQVVQDNSGNRGALEREINILDTPLDLHGNGVPLASNGAPRGNGGEPNFLHIGNHVPDASAPGGALKRELIPGTPLDLHGNGVPPASNGAPGGIGREPNFLNSGNHVPGVSGLGGVMGVFRQRSLSDGLSRWLDGIFAGRQPSNPLNQATPPVANNSSHGRPAGARPWRRVLGLVFGEILRLIPGSRSGGVALGAGNPMPAARGGGRGTLRSRGPPVGGADGTGAQGGGRGTLRSRGPPVGGADGIGAHGGFGEATGGGLGMVK